MSRRRLGLRGRLLLSHGVVAAIGAAVLLAAAWLVGPAAFEARMGHGSGGVMGDMMNPAVRQAFAEALATALLAALAVTLVAALAASLVLAHRLSAPIARLADGARQLAAGRREARVEVGGPPELTDLALAFNQMAAALEALERRRVELVGDVAHELRTPLATLAGYVDGLEDGVVAADADAWRTLRRETARLTRLVDDLQQLWRAEDDQLELRPDRLSLDTLLTEVAARFAPTAAQHDVSIAVRIGEGTPPVLADRERTLQVLDNLVSNAIRHAPAGSSVTIGADTHADGASFWVTDTGPGLTPAQLKRVFDRFYRVDPARSRAVGGSGIGLAIARALVTAMRGSIRAESGGPGTGSTFRVTLPSES